ncbi:MAG TPA: hypothetical protein VLJ59_07355 [Mycobacteriales bacterium]|nr:hypothetical protein [Mycobacteriales bacterium]
MTQTHERMFYEVMWRACARQATYPLPWWAQQTFRRWSDNYDSGLFDSKEAAFAANALYRYWNMIGVKDAGLESLVGQAGEIEPVYESYAVSGFIYEPEGRRVHLPQVAELDRPLPAVGQWMEDGFLPVVVSTFRTGTGVVLEQKALSTTVGLRQRSVVLHRLRVRAEGGARRGWLCLALLPWGPSSFQRHDRAGRYLPDRQLSYVRYRGDENRVEVNAGWGPIFDTAPAMFGVYGNATSSDDPDAYLVDNPWHDLATAGGLNGADTARDAVASMCTAAFAWPYDLASGESFSIDVRLPVDDYRSPGDLDEIRGPTADDLEAANRLFWVQKLNGSGLQLELPPLVAHVQDLFRLCRANLLILADGGAIHPGPTIYDSFWVRDSSVEGIACALAGDTSLAATQFGEHYPLVFNQGFEQIGPASAHGFFGGDHEKNDLEWDSNGQALWAFGRFDRIQGRAEAFGAKMFSPYVIEGARWIRDNRSHYGLLHSGWSAEHLGDRDKPHYWDDFWGVAGLYEAARLAERVGAAEAAELWSAYDELGRATADSIRWVLNQQRAMGRWETFIPTGPGDVGRFDSTMVGALAYFHPCRLYMGEKLGGDIDAAARSTLETIWSHFVRGGFRHDAAWNAYGPYLTLQLAHAFLLIGDVARMDQCLTWAVGDAAYSTVSRYDGAPDAWQVVAGAWNEQHAYPIATDFAEVPDRWWYMGDIPHGWAAAELILLLRDICFFEADEDGAPTIYLALGVPPHWLAGGQAIGVRDAPTVFGTRFGFTLRHDEVAKTVTLDVAQPPPAGVGFVYPCRLGPVRSAVADGAPILAPPAASRDLILPAGLRRAVVTYG